MLMTRLHSKLMIVLDGATHVPIMRFQASGSTLPGATQAYDETSATVEAKRVRKEKVLALTLSFEFWSYGHEKVR